MGSHTLPAWMLERAIPARDRALALIGALRARTDEDVQLSWFIVDSLLAGDDHDLANAVRRVRRQGLAIDRRALYQGCGVAGLDGLRHRWPRVAAALEEVLPRSSTTALVAAPTVTWPTSRRGAA
jgi:hypothetical protein